MAFFFFLENKPLFVFCKIIQMLILSPSVYISNNNYSKQEIIFNRRISEGKKSNSSPRDFLGKRTRIAASQNQDNLHDP